MRLHLFLIFIALKITTTNLLAQQATDDIVLKALQDEIARNMTELKLPDLEKPFFMMYGVIDQKTYAVTASLGSLTRSSVTHDRFKTTTRVLVGDYTFNDESLEDNLFSGATSNEIDIPLEDDYMGIRRSFWSATDKVYRDAARNLEKNKEALKETGKNLNDIPHRSFAKKDPVTIINTATPFNFDKTAWENKARKLSELFLKHPAIWNSGVMINCVEGYRYLVNSEGTLVKVPFRAASFSAMALSKNAEGEQSVNSIIHLASTPDKLPDDQLLTNEIEMLIKQLENQSSVTKFSEEYSGPVLVMGEAVAEVFASGIFNSISASDNIPKLTGYQYDDLFDADNKIGKNIMSESVSITARPKLKSYNGIDLLGSFEIDNEGVAPNDEVKIVERGVLKCLLNNRTITSPTQTANGFGSGPGVIEINVSEKFSEKSMKKKLLDRAKKQGLDYALIVRGNANGGFRLLDVYKVSLADGKEELVRGASLNRVEVKVLKHILGASDKNAAYNVGNFNNTARGGATLTSYIVPEAVLFEELEVNRFHLPSVKETDYVQNPLAQYQK